VAIGMPSFNHSFSPEVTAVGLSSVADTQAILSPLYEPLSAETMALLRAAQDDPDACLGSTDGPRMADRIAIARARVRDMLDSDLASFFDLGADLDLMARYGITDPSDASDPAVIAATTWRLFETGLSTSVTAQLQRGLDTHGEQW